MNRIILNIIHGCMIGIVAATTAVFILQPSAPDRVFVPVDRVALPVASEPCDCKCGNGCKCDACDCCKPSEVVFAEDPKPAKPQPPKVLSVDPVTGFAATKAAVVMISRPWCGPCQAWKNGPMPGQLMAQGWEFAINEQAPAASFPTYRVFDGKQWHTVKGALTGTRLRMLLNPRYDPAVPMRERVEAKPSGVNWTIDSQPWTRETLIDHLATHPNHGHSRQMLERMTLEQLNQLHTDDHEGRGRTVARSAGVSK